MGLGAGARLGRALARAGRASRPGRTISQAISKAFSRFQRRAGKGSGGPVGPAEVARASAKSLAITQALARIAQEAAKTAATERMRQRLEKQKAKAEELVRLSEAAAKGNLDYVTAQRINRLRKELGFDPIIPPDTIDYLRRHRYDASFSYQAALAFRRFTDFINTITIAQATSAVITELSGIGQEQRIRDRYREQAMRRLDEIERTIRADRTLTENQRQLALRAIEDERAVVRELFGPGLDQLK